ncbi:thioesterase family protein [Nocardia aobensis]|uniref:Thioesterase family protein n=1 Tax=Nocardia aobensis TaxID=257277 RepID=A0ABW6PDM4_9NOCA
MTRDKDRGTIMGFFTRQGEAFVAQELAISGWAPTQLGGHAVCGLLARQLETHCPEGYQPARLTVDLFRPVRNQPVEVRSEIVRQGKRITVADAVIVQDGEPVVRSSAVFLVRGVEPPGRIWNNTPDLPMPHPVQDSPHGSPPLFKSGDRDWTHDFAVNQNADRKTAWMVLPSLVEGEQISPFQRAAMIGDMTNHVCHWGSDGAGYINADMTLTLARLPIGHEIGIRAENTLAADGISLGSAALYDRSGAVGGSVVTALSNPRRQIDYAAAEKS